MESATVVFAGGGSGGHIFPALAIAEAIDRKQQGVGHIFLCSDRSLDREILDRAGVDCLQLPARPFSLRPAGLVRCLSAWGPSLRTARQVIREAGGVGPVHVVALGGFVTPPVVQAARAERLECTVVNLDAVPGRAIRWSARRATHCCSTAVSSNGWTEYPPVVREQGVAHDSRKDCRESFGLDPTTPTLLVTGASQGARSINRFMMAFARERSASLEGWQVIHQTGSGEDGEAADVWAAAGVRARVVAFIEQMGSAWKAADVAVSRAGAGSVGEAWANRVPTLFMPYPHHRDEHQSHNAARLLDCGAAVIERDRIDPEKNLEGPGAALCRLLDDAAGREAMRRAYDGLGPADGAQRVADHVLGCLKNPKH